MIVKASAAMLAFELFAIVTGRRRTWSQARGPQRLVFIGWLVALIVHVGYEWIADDIGRAAAEAI